MPAAAPEPPVTWNVFPLATAIGWPLKFPNHARTPALLVMSRLTIPGEATTPPIDTSDCVVSGTPTAEPALDAVDAPSEFHPVPFVYPLVCVGISVPAADAVLAVELIRIRIAEAASAVNDPGIPAAPVGVVAFRMLEIIVLSIAAIYRSLPSSNGT